MKCFKKYMKVNVNIPPPPSFLKYTTLFRKMCIGDYKSKISANTLSVLGKEKIYPDFHK